MLCMVWPDRWDAAEVVSAVSGHLMSDTALLITQINAEIIQ